MSGSRRGIRGIPTTSRNNKGFHVCVKIPLRQRCGCEQRRTIGVIPHPGVRELLPCLFIGYMVLLVGLPQRPRAGPQVRFLLARPLQGRLLMLVRICCCCGRRGTTKLVGGSCPLPSASTLPMKT